MRKDACFYLGHFSGLYSFKGELLIKLDTDDPEYFTELESILVYMPTGLVPFFISDIRLHKSSLLRVKLETIDSEATAKPLLKKSVYLPLELLPQLEDTQFYYHEIIGWTAVDQNKGQLGTIAEVNDQSSQVLLKIDSGEKSILVPLHDDFIVQIDREKKVFHFNLPEGIIDLN